MTAVFELMLSRTGVGTVSRNENRLKTKKSFNRKRKRETDWSFYLKKGQKRKQVKLQES